MWLSQSRDQAIPACSLLQRQGINTTDVSLLPLQSAGRRQKVKKMIDTGGELGVMPLSPPFFLVHFASSLSLDSQTFPRWSLHITEENMAPWNRQPEEKVVKAIWRHKTELGGLAWPAQDGSVTP